MSLLTDKEILEALKPVGITPGNVLYEASRAIEQAVMQKPLEQKPVAWVHSSGFVTKDADWVFDRKEECEPLYLHPAPSAPKSPFTAGEDNDGWYVEFEGDQIAYGLTEEKANHIVSNYNAPSAPEGMVLVHTEPTDKMLEAAWELNLALEGIRQHCTNRYKAMLIAARSE